MRTPSAPRRNASSLLLAALVLGASLAIPVGSADPVTDAQRWLGCAEWIIEESLNTVDPYRNSAAFLLKQAKCKLKLRAQPVRIDNDADLYVVNAAGVVVPNHANGVVGGTGTAADPFVIGGFEFDGKVVACPAISITGVNAHVKVAGNWIHDMGCGSSHGGPVLVVNGLPAPAIIEGNLFSAVKTAMSVNSYRVVVRNNVIENAYGVTDPGTQTVLSQGSAWSWYSAMYVHHSYGATIQNNVIRKGASPAGSADLYSWGIGSEWNMDVRIQGNHITSAASEGIYNIGVQGLNYIEGNYVNGLHDRLWYGIRTESGGTTFIRYNTVCNADVPVSGGQVVHDNGC